MNPLFDSSSRYFTLFEYANRWVIEKFKIYAMNYLNPGEAQPFSKQTAFSEYLKVLIFDCIQLISTAGRV